MTTRIEKDSLGLLHVPAQALYGIQTQRALNNFYITGQKTHPAMIEALGYVKKACAIANMQCGQLDSARSQLIQTACDEVIAHQHDAWFVSDPIQGGAGTSMNMNANEVIANRCAQLSHLPLGTYEYIHPNDHVNFGQSTNDVFPTAGKIAALFLKDQLVVEIQRMRAILMEKSEAFDDVIKIGRTHLQDAVPIRMGQEFHAFYSSFGRDLKRIEFAFNDLLLLNTGATAVGTGLNCDQAFPMRCVSTLHDLTGFDFVSSSDLVDATRNVDAFAFAHSSLKTLAINLSRMANDLRMMASGPRAGLAEITIPARQPGSSIMPGKVNPVIFEVCNQVSFQVFGHDETITKAAEAGQFELNVFEPVLFFNLFSSIEMLTHAIETLCDNALIDVQANRSQCEHILTQSLSAVTALSPIIGYQKTSALAKEALAHNQSLEQVIMSHHLLSERMMQKVMDYQRLTHPGMLKSDSI